MYVYMYSLWTINNIISAKIYTKEPNHWRDDKSGVKKSRTKQDVRRQWSAKLHERLITSLERPPTSRARQTKTIR